MDPDRRMRRNRLVVVVVVVVSAHQRLGEANRRALCWHWATAALRTNVGAKREVQTIGGGLESQLHAYLTHSHSTIQG